MSLPPVDGSAGLTKARVVEPSDCLCLLNSNYGRNKKNKMETDLNQGIHCIESDMFAHVALQHSVGQFPRRLLDDLADFLKLFLSLFFLGVLVWSARK